MSVLKRALVAITMMAVTLGVASVPALTAGSATAAPANPSACAQAQSDVAKKTTAVKKAKKAATKAKKALKKTKKKAAVNKATKKAVKKALKKAAKSKVKFKAAKKAKKAAIKTRAAKCKDVANPAGDPLGQLLALLSQSGSLPGNVGGVDGQALNLTQLNGLLALLGGGATPSLDPAMLLGILNGFNNSPLDPAALSGLLDGVLSPAAITGLLSGGADPAALLGLFQGLLGQFASLGGTSALPLPTSPADVLALFDMFGTGLGALTGLLDPAQLGSLLGLLAKAGALAGGNSPISSLDATQLTALLTNLIGPDALGVVDPTMLTGLLGGFNALPTDPSQVFALFGGLLDPAQLVALLSGAASDEVFGQAVAQMLATFSVITGGDFAFPSGLDIGVLTGLVDVVVDLVDDLLGGLLGGGGGGIPIVCDLLPLPILCK